MFSVIVVGTDGSETAGSAVALAVELVREGDATLHLVAGVRLPGAVSVPAAGVHALDHASEPHLRQAAQSMLEMCPKASKVSTSRSIRPSATLLS